MNNELMLLSKACTISQKMDNERTKHYEEFAVLLRDYKHDLYTPVLSEGRQLCVISNILNTKDERIIRMFFDKYKGIKMDFVLSLNFGRYDKLNIFQFLCLEMPELLKYFKRYSGLSTEEIQELIDREILYVNKHGKEEPYLLAAHFVNKISIEQLYPSMEGLSLRDVADMEDTWCRWHRNGNPQNKFIFKTKPHIVWNGRIECYKAMRELGLKLDGGLELLEFVEQYSGDYNSWNSFLDLMYLYRGDFIRANGAPSYDNGAVSFDARINNGFGLCPIDARITIDFRPLKELMLEYARVDNLRDPKVAHLEDRIDRAEITISTIPSVMADQISAGLSRQREYPEAAVFFNILKSKTDLYLNAMLLANSGRFKVKATTQSARVAIQTQHVFSTLAQNSSVPLLGIIPAVTAGIVDLSTQRMVDKQAKGVFSATLGQNTERLSIYVAIVLLCECMNKNPLLVTAGHAQNLSNQVKKQIDNLHRIDNQQELVAFMCYSALNTIRQSSSTTQSFTPSYTAISDGYYENQAPKPSVRCAAVCSIM